MPCLYFGGSFNPVHRGHLVCGRAVADNAGFDQIALVPAAVSPHKLNDPHQAPAADRLAMCLLAAADPEADGRVAVDEIEIHETGPSYTLDTVKKLKSRGEGEIHWLIGADQVPRLPQWHRPQELLAEAKIVVMARPGFAIDWSALPDWLQVLQEQVVKAPLMDVSASEIRKRVAAGERIDHMVPAAVDEYIRKRGLYRSKP